jgi:hypothetical protein
MLRQTPAPAAANVPWVPDRAHYVAALRFPVRSCYWCGGRIEAQTPVVWYPNEKATAHATCHAEACE